MIFNQLEFLFVFLPVVALAFFVRESGRWRLAVLVAASFVFYGLSGVRHAVVLAADVVWVYAITCHPSIAGSRGRLVLAILPPILFLVYFKYSGFLAFDVVGIEREPSGAAFSLFEQVALPAGISFFTFQVVAYAVDRFRGTVAEPVGLLRFSLFVSFFPQLVAGPIVRYSEVTGAIARLGRWRLDAEALRAAAGYVVCGLALKVLGADSLARYCAPLVAAPGELTAGAAAYVLFAYSFRIYFDFFGYSLIAIGLGRLFGFALPANFVRPYESENPRDFWRRWHITLSFWIRDYLYLPLGGNRRYVVNIVLVFAVCGLWHGAGWNFVVWGLYHAALVGGYRLVAPGWQCMPRRAQVAVTFLAVSLGWLLFLFDLPTAAVFATSLLGGGSATLATDSAEMWVVLAAAAGVCFGCRFEAAIERGAAPGPRSYAYTVGLALAVLATVLFVDVSDDFIYFRF